MAKHGLRRMKDGLWGLETLYNKVSRERRRLTFKKPTRIGEGCLLTFKDVVRVSPKFKMNLEAVLLRTTSDYG